MHVLLVEDDRHIRTVLLRSLEAFGYDVAAASSAGEAIALLNKMSFQALVVDINLPDDTGWAVIDHQVTTANAGAFVIVMSAVRPSVSRLHKHNPSGVLLKPFPVDALHRLIQLASKGTEGAHDAYQQS